MRNLRLAILVGLASLALLIVTEPGMSIVWDEDEGSILDRSCFTNHELIHHTVTDVVAAPRETRTGWLVNV